MTKEGKMSEKSNEGMTRREATHKILTVIALATGLSISEVRSLLAADKAILNKTVTVKPSIKVTRPLSRTLVIPKKSTNDKVKALKVLLENSVEVFENEYGRSTPVQTGRVDELLVGKTLPPGMAGDIVNVCGTHFDPSGFGSGAVGLVGCSGANTCTGQDLTGSGGDGEPCWGTNDCNGQSCPKMGICTDNTCEDQDCPKLGICEKNNQSLTTADFLSDVTNDAYIGLLLQEFNVTTVEALQNLLNDTLNSLSTGKALQWPPK